MHVKITEDRAEGGAHRQKISHEVKITIQYERILLYTSASQESYCQLYYYWQLYISWVFIRNYWTKLKVEAGICKCHQLISESPLTAYRRAGFTCRHWSKELDIVSFPGWRNLMCLNNWTFNSILYRLSYFCTMPLEE